MQKALNYVSDSAFIRFALRGAIGGGHREATEYLAKLINRPYEVLIVAADVGNLELVKSSKSYHWHDALLMSARSGHLEIIKYCENKLGRRTINWQQAALNAVRSRDVEVFNYCLGKIDDADEEFLFRLTGLVCSYTSPSEPQEMIFVVSTTLEMLLAVDAICPINWYLMRRSFNWSHRSYVIERTLMSHYH